MSVYLVTFDIKDTARLKRIKEHIVRTRQGYCPIHENAWAIIDDRNPLEIVNELILMTTLEDKIFIIRSGMEAAWNSTYGELNSNWLKQNL